MEEIIGGVERIDFHHPYTPYDVQEQFMNTAYEVLQQGEGQIGILESPTGTGKSLSLICAALTWLRNHKRSKFETSVTEAAQEFKDEPDWIVDQMLKRKRDEIIKQWEEREARLRKIRAKEKMTEERGSKRRRLEDGNARKSKKTDNDDDDDEWLLDEGQDEDASQDSDNPLGFSKETRNLMNKLGLGSLQTKEESEEMGENEIKIYYTSRTHSQLTQFISELRRPNFPASLPDSLLGDNSSTESEGIKHLPLSSRQRLCINPSVSRLSSLPAINDRCTELQQPKSKDRCQFVPNADSLSLTHQFRDSALATLPDIEDLFELGKKLHVCPYYASRTAVPSAEIITLPYPLLLQKTARDALGIKLEGNVVIVDEAHNIMDAVANVYASEISLNELKRARQMLGVYVKKFGKKLKGGNRVMVAQVAKVVDGLRVWLESASELKSDQGIVDPNVLLKSKGIDQINMYKLIQYIQDSKLAYKIEGYVAQAESQGAGDASSIIRSTPVLHTLLSFLVSLNNLSSEGRIFYHKVSQDDIKLSYLLLSPTHAFSSIASSARAVILAGGTMSPFEDYTAHLFPDLAQNKITTLSCGHVIPSSNLCVWTLSSPRPKTDTRSVEFEFSFQKRSDKSMIYELGIAILNICTAVPDGVVIFFPSYGYLDEVVSVWSEVNTGQPKPLMEKLQAKKAVFRETKGASSDEVLAQYSEAILGDSKPGPPLNRNGALLLSVVGGKMSEGINFSDRLGRCVVVVGLPYPNIHSPDWKARIEYIESTTLERIKATNPSIPKGEALVAAKQAARDFYENACMRAVNQSIGRAIRHRNDYAAIVLVDRRFAADRIKTKLPGWIRDGLVEGSENGGLGQMMGKLSSFFRGKKALADA
ncbi:ATP-dependent RNA helicase chl1 [Daldinia childiae]|uniref:ATP-dependent RNA helicase chl1 n=1 Tax=Daldinia childiae TaxID=326645 RepID=UPI001445168D|nr:ATP-dependent RNA helicase chl1 [Daldinia childiae]KAF3066395.1 ATP-dependent RNA helicase chl1 [Daldinia childiae]